MTHQYFYKSAIIDGKKIKPQELMFIDAKAKGHTFYCSCDNVYHNSKKGLKKYTSFTDINEFLEYEKTLNQNELNMYEMFTDELVEVYDIDGDYTKSSFLLLHSLGFHLTSYLSVNLFHILPSLSFCFVLSFSAKFVFNCEVFYIRSRKFTC